MSSATKPTVKDGSSSTFQATPALRLRRMAFFLLLLLGAQFFLGMWNNLYTSIPASHPGTNAGNYFVGVGEGIVWSIAHSAMLALQLHVILGLLLLLFSILLIVSAYTAGTRVWKIAAPIGAFGILGAAFNGASFINYGHNISSLLMSTGFLIALVAYIIGLYLSVDSATGHE